MDSINIPKNPNFRWLPKHLHHITENIVFKNRNISFLAINALFRQTKTHTVLPSDFGNDHANIRYTTQNGAISDR